MAMAFSWEKRERVLKSRTRRRDVFMVIRGKSY
jgi:hypothetical protein